jgi:hypothetical protein
LPKPDKPFVPLAGQVAEKPINGPDVRLKGFYFTEEA